MTLYLLIALAVALLPLGLDCLQSVQIALDPQKWVEKNPILGPHPDVFGVLRYFTVAAWVLFVLTFLLPQPFGLLTAITAAVVEVVVVVRNWRLGIPFTA